ncbi:MULTISPECIES: hypothetical protein [unclassified Bacillus (in: firmicutes)]|uniref:hypothetical protein n=1 Tax=unclassified Bacillus (in: firmicutes) TaxID=185979 RepID=UPI0008E2E8AF|nr:MULTISPECIES: hypothetical protein [unclassified Bacillus (in: firmicutes)]SFB19902.1 hypothetical protein SAMN02799634_10845 [Bacillus sp. UNCCL13]SFQ90780.1 hypothetical protein SAMN04488577_3861 [Bacillus sp. cl95]
MAQQELLIDYDYYENKDCSFDDLKEASNKLSSASQEQFEQIKNEKWFHRVFDMVTLSKKQDKRMANQIGTLAQAQQILMDILVRLSERDVKVSDLVTEAFDKIERLSRNDILLAKKLNVLEKRCILGITKETDIASLSETEREILGGAFYSLMHQFEGISVDQQQYANNLLNYLEVDAQNIELHASLASINDIEAKKKILTSCLEYSFLNTLDFELPDGVEDIIDEFDFGNKTIREIKTKITSLYRLRGKQGFIDKYSADEEAYEEEFYVEMSEFLLDEEIIELEEVNISSILYIPRGEKRVFKNKIVHISAYMNCEGHLEFDNCIVYYNESHVSDEITLSEGASITFTNCQVNCLGYDKNSFVQAEGKNEIIIKNTEFNNCNHFLQLKGDTDLQVQNCAIFSPDENFIRFNGWGNTVTGEISDTKIHFLKNADDESDSTWASKDGIINIDGSISITNCEVRGLDHYEKEKMKSFLFNISEAVYKNCSFLNINKCIQRGALISESSFDSCTEVIENQTFTGSSIEVMNCLFKNCENVTSGDNLTIKNSQFVDCRNKIANGSGITVEFCEFYNLFSSLSGILTNASFDFTCGKNSATNYISKCLFDGVRIEEGFLVQGNTYEKISGPKVYVKDCDFRHCTTTRSTNVIVREYNHYYGLFDRRVETNPVSISNCRGLENVNEGDGFAEEVIIRSVTPTGMKIGVAVAGAVGGLPGLAIGMGVAKFLKDDDIRVE